MSIVKKIKYEIKQVGLVALYFFTCFGILLTLKKLYLAQVQIEFYAFPAALFGALFMAKVVVLLDKTRLRNVYNNDALYKSIMFKSMVYTLVAAFVVFLEHVVHAYMEEYSLQLAVIQVFKHRDINQFLIIIICSFISLSGYNAMIGISNHLEKGELINLFFKKRN